MQGQTLNNFGVFAQSFLVKLCKGVFANLLDLGLFASKFELCFTCLSGPGGQIVLFIIIFILETPHYMIRNYFRVSTFWHH